MTLDICQRLPTIQEVKCIQANDGRIPDTRLVSPSKACLINFDSVINSCLKSESFAESIGRWVNDFVLPSQMPGYNSYNNIILNEVTLNDGSTQKYWYGRHSSWGNCLDGITPTQTNLSDYLDKAYAPYFANGKNGGTDIGVESDSNGDFVYVCKKTGDDGRIYSLADEVTNYENFNGTTTDYQCTQSDSRFPCGCGPNMRWCMVRSNLTNNNGTVGVMGNDHSWFRLKKQTLEEAGQFTKQVVLNENGILASKNPTFTDIFNADYAVRTSRLQHFYEIMQADLRDPDNLSDDCHRLISGIDKSASCPTTVSGTVDFVDYTDAASAPAGVVVDENGGDWQVIDFSQQAPEDKTTPLAYQNAGILASWQLLNRQPTELNIANRIFSFWTCEEISWRSNDPYNRSNYQLERVEENEDGFVTLYSLDDIEFNTLYRTAAALEPFEEGTDNYTNCSGCHVTVNPLAAFRNRWDQLGRYREVDYKPVGSINGMDPGTVSGDQGIFLGETGVGLAGLGNILAESPVVHRCIVNRSFERLVGYRLPSSSDTLQDLTETFLSSNKDIRSLYGAILTTAEYKRAR